MNQMLLLVQDEADAANLTNAGRWLVQHGVTSAWVLLSPQVLVSTEAASAKIDGEIAELRALEASAAASKKYGEAEGFSKQIDVKLMDKAQEVAVAYRNLTPEESTKRQRELVGGIFEIAKEAGMNFKAQCEKVHYETANFVNFLNSTLAARPPGFEPGNFGVVWAAALNEETSPIRKIWEKPVEPKEPNPAPMDAAPQEKRSPGRPKFDPSLRRNLEELEALAFFSLMAVAKHHGIDVPKGQPKEETIKQIWMKQGALNVAA